MTIEVVPVLVAGIAATAVGVIWYVVFAGALKRIRPLSPAEEEQAQRQMRVAFVVGVLLTLLMAVVLFHFVTISDRLPCECHRQWLDHGVAGVLGICLAGPDDAYPVWELWGVGDKAQTPWHQYRRSTRIAARDGSRDRMDDVASAGVRALQLWAEGPGEPADTNAILTWVYIPDHFRPADEDVAELLANIGAADLVTATAEGLLATMLPADPRSRPGPSTQAVGAHGRLMGHVARNNRQWKVPPIGGAMVIVRGPDAYISPAWYAAKREHGRVVPTWNYITAHIHGELVIHDDPAWVDEPTSAPLTARHEASRPVPWSVDDAPGPYIEGQLRAIVGVETASSAGSRQSSSSARTVSTADVDGAIAGLLAGPAISNTVAAAMDAIRRRR